MKILEHYSEWNELMEWCIRSKVKVVKEGKGYGKHKNKTTSIGEAFISEGAKTVQLLVKMPGKWDRAEQFKFFLDGEPDYTQDSNLVAVAMKQLYGYWKPQALSEKEKSAVGSASPILGYNEKLSGGRYTAYEYDLKSAYSWGMIQDLPDVDGECRLDGILGEDEIGFNTHPRNNGTRVLVAEFEKGKKCKWIFKKKESPYKPFVEKYFKKKEQAKSKREKMRYKAYLNVVVGQLQNHNPFVRACIVGRINNRISSAIDENTLMWNTDAIISLTKRDDLELGDEIGMWSIKHEGKFAYIGHNYQWNNEVPGWRGIPKAWFPPDFDLLKDEVPDRQNPYIFSWETGMVSENEYYHSKFVEEDK